MTEFKIVPVEPTEAMILAGEKAAWDDHNMMPAIRAMSKAYAAMLSDAPASPLAEGGGPTCQVCGGVIEAWICQGCGAQFHESDAGSLVLGMATAEPAGQLSKNLGQRKSEHIGETTEKVDLDALEKLADEATPGRWMWDGYGLSSLTNSEPVIHDLGYDGLWIDEKGPDAAFIAAANPATIKALIAELKEARAALEPFAAHFVIYRADTPPMTVIPLTTEYRHIRRAFLARNGKGEG